MSWEDRLLLIWIISAAIVMVIIVTIFVWAIRSGQFKHQNHASRLPLESPDDLAPPDEKNQRRNEHV